MKNFFKILGRNIIMVMVVILTATGTIWVYAAFLEPSVDPANSVQDFNANIMGSNSNNNTFDSSLVVPNVDGSVIERLEYISDYLGG